MLVKALLILGIDIAIVFALGVWLQLGGHPLGPGILWGLFGGVVCALSAIGGAWWAEIKRLPPNTTLAIVVAGMLGRMFFLGAWALLAIKLGEADGLGFLGGFGAVYLLGQILEVWMLARLKDKKPT